MKNCKGITLMIVIMTVIILTILVGLIITNSVNTWNDTKVVKFKTNMELIQKKVDILLEEGKDYTTVGSIPTNEQITILEDIINNDTNNYIETRDTTNTGLRYFSSSDIETVFDLKGVDDEFIINFTNREVISLNGVEKDGVMYYVRKGL